MTEKTGRWPHLRPWAALEHAGPTVADQVHAALDLTAMPPIRANPAPTPPIPATQALGDNLRRSLDTYASRAVVLQAQIDNATRELVDVRKAQEAATAALDAMLGDVAQHSLELELSA